MLINTDRGLAVLVLSEILEHKAYSNIALRKALSESSLDARSRAFVTDLVNETIRNLLLIDTILEQFSKTPLLKMKANIRNILRIAVCQILFMEHIPDRAAVNEAVNLTKQLKLENLSGFVNGILRTILREDIDLNQITDPAIRYSYPKWLYHKLTLQLGSAKTLELAQQMHRIPQMIVLTNTVKTNVQLLKQSLEAEGVLVQMLNGTNIPFLSLKQTGDITKLTAFKQGWFYVMDPGAYHAVLTLDAKPGQTIIDLCAAPGGKSFATAMNMNNKGIIHAFDKHAHKIELLFESRRRLGLTCIQPKLGDATILNPDLINAADAVLLDAPCSGLGTIRKHPEIKYNRNIEDVQTLAEIQLSMLDVAAEYVKPGGILVYCTCTLLDEENNENIASFLSEREDFICTEMTNIMPCADNDGFFIAKLMKQFNTSTH